MSVCMGFSLAESLRQRDDTVMHRNARTDNYFCLLIIDALWFTIISLAMCLTSRYMDAK